MTCREKLAIEHRDNISSDYPGGCLGCPHTYGYLSSPHYCTSISSDRDKLCTDCWDREIPGTSTTKTIYAHIGPFDDVSSADIHENCKVADGIKEGLSHPNPEYVDAFKKIGESAAKTAKSIGLIIGDEKVEHPDTDMPKILDSGNRREFETGAVRDIHEGKGRCDLLPLDVVADCLNDELLNHIASFQRTGDVRDLSVILDMFASHWDDGLTKLSTYDIIVQRKSTMFLEVAKHYEEGCNKYGPRNWEKGIPVRCYIDSGVRHYLKFLRGDMDEPHDRAFVWNILGAIWTCEHKPELNEYPINLEVEG
jgi:hypothetical protein